ncbi:MAG: hypothetical protein F6K35_08800 [Okeania sp. SIO2H7]|nr:hypothetical protein [Okeania sp. SIO2H7]
MEPEIFIKKVKERWNIPGEEFSEKKAIEIYQRFKFLEPYFCMGTVEWDFKNPLDYSNNDFYDLDNDSKWENWGEFYLGEVKYLTQDYCLIVLHRGTDAILRIFHLDDFPKLLYYNPKYPDYDNLETTPESAFYGTPLDKILVQPLEEIGEKFLTPYKPESKEESDRFEKNFCQNCARYPDSEESYPCSILTDTSSWGTQGHEWVHDVFNYPACLGYD